MALQTSGAITFAQIQAEFGGANPISLSEYYAGGAYVSAGTSGTNGAVPSSGAISPWNFYGTSDIASWNYNFNDNILPPEFSIAARASSTLLSGTPTGGELRVYAQDNAISSQYCDFADEWTYSSAAQADVNFAMPPEPYIKYLTITARYFSFMRGTPRIYFYARPDPGTLLYISQIILTSSNAVYGPIAIPANTALLNLFCQSSYSSTGVDYGVTNFDTRITDFNLVP